MKKLLKLYEDKKPEIVLSWNDPESEAKGWLVINSLHGGAAGGGTRMKKGIDLEEVILLAKTMEIKFTVSGPEIGGAKSGIDFDPSDPRKNEVLKRWYKAISPMLKNCYGTGGDLNVDFVNEVIPFTKELGIIHPQEGIVCGHYGREEKKRLNNLIAGTSRIVKSTEYSPDNRERFTVADLISGYSVAESVAQYYKIFGGNHQKKRAIIQGWGNVGSAAGYYLAKSGIDIIGILDKDGGVINEDGFTLSEIREFILNQKRTKFSGYNIVPYHEMEHLFWHLSADIFLPCAASKLITKNHVRALIDAGLSLISCGANVPFADRENFFGPIAAYADNRISVIPDFIANCGMARVFAYLMEDNAEFFEENIFQDVSQTVYRALLKACDNACSPLGITQRVLENAISERC
jgi:glutamate dehydrogenase/leucine dehydrogenase